MSTLTGLKLWLPLKEEIWIGDDIIVRLAPFGRADGGWRPRATSLRIIAPAEVKIFRRELTVDRFSIMDEEKR